MNDAILLQQCLSAGGYTRGWSGVFYDQLRLTMQRHAAYARAHNIDYQITFGDVHHGKQGGAWDKIELILAALARGYNHIFWLDTDAAIMDFGADLRDALPEGGLIGAVEHDPERSKFLQVNQVPKHRNVGVLYVKRDHLTANFFRDWLASWPGDARWKEQGEFNRLSAGLPWVVTVEDRWNATVNVNMVTNPVVLGWHGIMPPEQRLGMMKQTLINDFLIYRV